MQEIFAIVNYDLLSELLNVTVDPADQILVNHRVKAICGARNSMDSNTEHNCSKC